MCSYDRRVYSLSSTNEAFNQECPRLSSIFTRLDYPVARTNSTITKTIKSFSFGTREKNEIAALCEWVCPSKIKHQLTQLQKANAWSQSQDWHYTTTRIWQQEIGRNKTASPEKSRVNRKSTMRWFFFYMWSVWFRLCQLYGSTPSSTYCWTKILRSVNN